MTTPVLEDLVTRNLAAADTFQSVSRIYLDATSRLAELNLTTLRELLSESAEMAKSLSAGAGKGPSAGSALGQDLAKPVLEKAMAYSKSLAEITAESQQQLAQVLKAQFSAAGLGQSLPGFWKDSMGALMQGTQQAAAAAGKAAQAARKSA